MTAGQSQDAGTLRDVALRLHYMVDQITPAEFRWQDANYDRDSALGRELLFLIADNEWARATSETIDIARSDTIETTIKMADRILTASQAPAQRRPGCSGDGKGQPGQPSPGRPMNAVTEGRLSPRARPRVRQDCGETAVHRIGPAMPAQSATLPSPRSWPAAARRM